MKTTMRTTLPDTMHEQPVHQLKLSKWVRYGFYSVAVLVPIGLGLSYFSMFERIGQSPSNQTMEVLIIGAAIYLLSYIICIAIIGLLAGDIYFYERYVEIRRFLPFMKRYVIYYDKMHVHISNMGHVILNHYKTQPKFWKSPYIWLKANFLYIINIPPICNSEIREFVKTKAQSVNAIETLTQTKTPTQTTLPGDTHEHEQPIYELKHPFRYKPQLPSRSFKCSFYFIAITFLLLSVFMWGVKVPELIKAGGPGIVIELVIVMIGQLVSIMVPAVMIRSGDIYFYERYVEIHCFLPFMKRHVIYYDKMHVHISNMMGRVNLNHYETYPKLWKSPYTWLKASFFDVIYFPLNYDFEIQEFVKTKAQSVSHYNLMGQKLN